MLVILLSEKNNGSDYSFHLQPQLSENRELVMGTFQGSSTERLLYAYLLDCQGLTYSSRRPQETLLKGLSSKSGRTIIHRLKVLGWAGGILRAASFHHVQQAGRGAAVQILQVTWFALPASFKGCVHQVLEVIHLVCGVIHTNCQFIYSIFRIRQGPDSPLILQIACSLLRCLIRIVVAEGYCR